MTDAATTDVTGPWGPGVTAYEAMKSVVSLHIADALLNSKSDAVRDWARELALELKRERIDLTGDIGQHLQRMAFEPRPVQLPF